MTTRTTIAGLFASRDDAQRAIGDLKDVGFTGAQIGIAMRDRNAAGQLVEDTGTHVAEGAVSGAVGGGLLGGLVGFLVGVGALAIPGIGPVVAGGALASAFGIAGGTAVAGAGIGAAAGGVVGALIGMGIPEEEARYFEPGFRAGGVLVTVNDTIRAAEALDILRRHGADTGPFTSNLPPSASTVPGVDGASSPPPASAAAPAEPVRPAAPVERVAPAGTVRRPAISEPGSIAPRAMERPFRNTADTGISDRAADTGATARIGHSDQGEPETGGGALAGAAAGAVAGATAGGVEGAARRDHDDDISDDAGAAGDVADVDADGNRVKRTYSGQVYEEGSLMDTARKDVI